VDKMFKIRNEEESDYQRIEELTVAVREVVI